VRVVPNKFAMLEGGGRPHRHRVAGGFLAMEGRGHHEVVVESPHHDWDIATGTVTEVRTILEAYRARSLALRDERSGVILPFRNHGVAAGTSLAHPHSQIVKTPTMPLRPRQVLDVARAYYDDFGSCLYVDVAKRELADGRRMVLATPALLAFQPFAAAAARDLDHTPRPSRVVCRRRRPDPG